MFTPKTLSEHERILVLEEQITQIKSNLTLLSPILFHCPLFGTTSLAPINVSFKGTAFAKKCNEKIIWIKAKKPINLEITICNKNATPIKVWSSTIPKTKGPTMEGNDAVEDCVVFSGQMQWIKIDATDADADIRLAGTETVAG